MRCVNAMLRHASWTLLVPVCLVQGCAPHPGPLQHAQASTSSAIELARERKGLPPAPAVADGRLPPPPATARHLDRVRIEIEPAHDDVGRPSGRIAAGPAWPDEHREWRDEGWSVSVGRELSSPILAGHLQFTIEPWELSYGSPLTFAVRARRGEPELLQFGIDRGGSRSDPRCRFFLHGEVLPGGRRWAPVLVGARLEVRLSWDLVDGTLECRVEDELGWVRLDERIEAIQRLGSDEGTSFAGFGWLEIRAGGQAVDRPHASVAISNLFVWPQSR